MPARLVAVIVLHSLAAALAGGVSAARQVTADGPSQPAESAFEPPWTVEELLALKAVGIAQLPLNAFAQWRSPGLDRAEFVEFLDELGVPATEADRRELLALWEGHRARMSALHASTARALWDTAERMGPEWERNPWSKAMMSLSAAQGKRLADAQLASIDDVRGLLAEVADRAPPGLRDQAQWLAASTVDRLLREDNLVVRWRAGGAAADLWELVQRASRGLAEEQRPRVQAALSRFWEETLEARRELVREGRRTMAIGYYIRVPDEERLRAVRTELVSPKTGHLLGRIREATRRTMDELASIIGAEAGARLNALLDAEASAPPGTPAAAFPDVDQGELKCQLLAIEPPALPQAEADVLHSIQESICMELSAVNAELRQNEWAESLLLATRADEPAKHAELRDRRQALLAQRTALNEAFRELLRGVLDEAALRELARKLN